MSLLLSQLGGTINVITGTGQLTLSGFAPSVIIEQNILTGVGSLVLTGFSPTIIISENIDPPALQIAVENRYRIQPTTTKRPYQRK